MLNFISSIIMGNNGDLWDFERCICVVSTWLQMCISNTAYLLGFSRKNIFMFYGES